MNMDDAMETSRVPGHPAADPAQGPAGAAPATVAGATPPPAAPTPPPAAPTPPPAAPTPPVAARRPHRLEAHGHERWDDYYWLRERDDPDVRAYLEAENAYTEAVLAPTRDLEERLYQEIVGRIDPTDFSVPSLERGWLYYQRYEEGREYPLHCRRRAGDDTPEQVMLDVNRLAEGHDYCAVHGLTVSDDGRVLAYAIDTVGRRIYTIRFRDLTTGLDLPDEIPQATPNLAWAADDLTLLYARQDPETLRFHRVLRHSLGTGADQDAEVFEEKDDQFSCYVWRTRSRRYLMIGSFQTVSSEIRFAPAEAPDGPWRVVHERERDHEYHVDHFGDRFIIRTNFGAPNFRLVTAPVDEPGMASWQEMLPHRDDVLIEGTEVFRDHLVVVERRDGLLRLRVRPWHGEEHYVEFEEPAYLAFPVDNRELETGTLRFVYSSLTTPMSTYDYDLVTRERTLRKRERVIGDFDPSRYRTERVHAVAPDGIRVPVSLVYRVDSFERAQRPLLLYGYGSYGFSTDAAFNSARLSLLDRGFVFAIAHVRGGQELGRRWYDDGRLLAKRNTFTDFIAAAEHLASEGYADPERLFAIGGSAGGLLVGAVINLRPDLFRGVVAAVPFVDVVTTMLDDTIPLTSGEYDEWGNPHDRTYYEYMLSYSPYDNLTDRPYPHLLVTTGLHDSQVQYWEPAKWVARMRALRHDDRRVLLRTNLDAGHGGQSGRFRRHRETAQSYAFLLDLAGMRE